MKHTTKEGNKIDLKDLETSHLKNIIALIERKAKTGITVKYGGGGSVEDMWYDEQELKGEDVLNHMGYSEYVAELKRR